MMEHAVNIKSKRAFLKVKLVPMLVALDEISLKKRHRYLTVIINRKKTGRVLWMGEGKEI